jgi:hypothetical protein
VKEVTAEVYALHEPGGDPWYVGCTGDGIDNRLADHQRKNPLCGPHTQIGLIETVTGTVRECGAAEVAWIDYGREVGWPLVNGPEDRPWKGPNSEAANEAIRLARIGVTHSEAARQKISEKGRERFADPKERERTAAKQRGKKDSEETRRHKSEAQRRSYDEDPERGQRQAAALRRHYENPEARARKAAKNRAMWQPGGSRYHERRERAVLSSHETGPDPQDG